MGEEVARERTINRSPRLSFLSRANRRLGNILVDRLQDSELGHFRRRFRSKVSNGSVVSAELGLAK
jgi:hypothetical protein